MVTLELLPVALRLELPAGVEPLQMVTLKLLLELSVGPEPLQMAIPLPVPHSEVEMAIEQQRKEN